MGHVSRDNIYYFLFLKYSYKKLSIPNCLTKTYKGKNDHFYSFKIQL